MSPFLWLSEMVDVCRVFLVSSIIHLQQLAFCFVSNEIILHAHKHKHFHDIIQEMSYPVVGIQTLAVSSLSHHLFVVLQVPLEGFKALQGISGPQRFQIHKAYGAPDRLPSAHTWLGI